jgi:hypothetical protein
MIASWKELVYTPDQTRQLQKNPRAIKSPVPRSRLARAEADVDACIKTKITEWAAREQPELLEVSHE